VLALLNTLFEVANIGGILVGGALALWFFVLGVVWLLLGWRPNGLNGRWLLRGLLIFAILWIAFGLMGQVVWLPWFLTAVRLLRWPFLALACLPWLLAYGLGQQGRSRGQRLLWWLAHSVVVFVGLLLLINLVPSMGVLILVLPLTPLVFGVMDIAGAAFDDAWPYAIGGALFFAWLLLAYFPLAG
jgi:hypothetical protein